MQNRRRREIDGPLGDENPPRPSASGAPPQRSRSTRPECRRNARPTAERMSVPRGRVASRWARRGHGRVEHRGPQKRRRHGLPMSGTSSGPRLSGLPVRRPPDPPGEVQGERRIVAAAAAPRYPWARTDNGTRGTGPEATRTSHVSTVPGDYLAYGPRARNHVPRAQKGALNLCCGCGRKGLVS